MTPAVLGLLLCAAALHATWNAVLRSGSDRLRSMTVMSFTTTAVALPFALLLPLPAGASWPYIALSSLLQLGYSVFLVGAYRHGELGQVYPIARGAAPLLAVVGAALFAGEATGAASLAGIALISSGIMNLALGKARATPVSVGLALGTAMFIASYTVTDGIGARLAGSPFSYMSWIFLLYGVLMPAAFFAVRRKLVLDGRSRETLKAAAGGVISLAAYVVVVWAMTLSPIGAVAALRETSIVFATIIGRVFLGERLTPRRLGACVAIALGAICLGYRP